MNAKDYVDRNPSHPDSKEIISLNKILSSNPEIKPLDQQALQNIAIQNKSIANYILKEKSDYHLGGNNTTDEQEIRGRLKYAIEKMSAADYKGLLEVYLKMQEQNVSTEIKRHGK